MRLLGFFKGKLLRRVAPQVWLFYSQPLEEGWATASLFTRFEESPDFTEQGAG